MMALLLPKGGVMPLYWSACYWVVLRRVFDLVMRFGTPSPQTYSIVDSLLLPRAFFNLLRLLVVIGGTIAAVFISYPVQE